MTSKISHLIKKRDKPKDVFYTPDKLAIKLIKSINIKPDDILFDAFKGKGVFYDNYPSGNKKEWCEITDNKDFFEYKNKVDWIITNPPYSIIDKVMNHSAEICNKGFGYLIGQGNLTSKRIEDMNKKGFILTKIIMLKVFKWYGMSYWVVFERKDGENIIEIDRTVWR